jgi:hypothetical protein
VLRHIAPELAHQMGLLPLAWLALLSWCGERRGSEWWWIAGAFGISWVADTISHVFGHPWIVSAVYPVSQAAILGMVLLPRKDAYWFVAGLCVLGVMAITVEGTTHPQWILHVVGWSEIVWLLWPLPLGKLRLALLVAFGVNIIPWVLFTIWTTWETWGLYQAVRATSLGLFCWACWTPQPRLQIA